MALSPATRRLIQAYDEFTNFAGGPDLPWVVAVYEELDDTTARAMIRALCYAWAAGQRAAGYYRGQIERLAQALFISLPHWNNDFPRAHKLLWLYRLGIQGAPPEPEQRPQITRIIPPSDQIEIRPEDREPIKDMAAFFQIDLAEATLLYRLGQALSTSDVRQLALGTTRTTTLDTQ